MYHNYSKDMMIGLAIAFAILPTAFVCLRLWAKRISKRIGWDDFLTLAALVRQCATKLCAVNFADRLITGGLLDMFLLTTSQLVIICTSITPPNDMNSGDTRLPGISSAS